MSKGDCSEDGIGKLSPKWRNMNVDSHVTPLEKQAPKGLKDLQVKGTWHLFSRRKL